MPNLIVALPVVSLIVERILEFFDLWIVLNLFPRWRSAPPPPPRKHVPKPSKLKWDRYHRASNGDEVEKPTFVCVVGSERVELPVNTYREAMSYYENERALYRDELERYVLRWGWFLLDRETATRPSAATSRSALARLCRSMRAPLAGPRLWVEACLADQQGILDTDETERFMHGAQNLIAGAGVEGTDQIHALEQMAHYCYFRSQCTYEQFTVRKRQLYVVLGMVMGGFLMYVARASLSALFGVREIFAPDMGGGVSGGAWGAVARFVLQSGNDVPPPETSWIWGTIAGLGSQPMHGFTNAVVNLPYPRRGYPSADIRGANVGGQTRRV